jgi:hypothetical protein
MLLYLAWFFVIAPVVAFIIAALNALLYDKTPAEVAEILIGWVVLIGFFWGVCYLIAHYAPHGT